MYTLFLDLDDLLAAAPRESMLHIQPTIRTLPSDLPVKTRVPAGCSALVVTIAASPDHILAARVLLERAQDWHTPGAIAGAMQDRSHTIAAYVRELAAQHGHSSARGILATAGLIDDLYKVTCSARYWTITELEKGDPRSRTLTFTTEDNESC